MKKDRWILIFLREVGHIIITKANLITSPVVAIFTLPVIVYYVPKYLLSHIIAIVILFLVWKAPEHD